MGFGKIQQGRTKNLLYSHYYKEKDNMVKKEIEDVFKINNWGR